MDKCNIRNDKENCCGCDLCGRMSMLENMTKEEYESYKLSSSN